MPTKSIEYKDIIENAQTNIARATPSARPKFLFMNEHMRERFGFTLKNMQKVYLENLFGERQGLFEI